MVYINIFFDALRDLFRYSLSIKNLDWVVFFVGSVLIGFLVFYSFWFVFLGFPLGYLVLRFITRDMDEIKSGTFFFGVVSILVSLATFVSTFAITSDYEIRDESYTVSNPKYVVTKDSNILVYDGDKTIKVRDEIFAVLKASNCKEVNVQLKKEYNTVYIHDKVTTTEEKLTCKDK